MPQSVTLTSQLIMGVYKTKTKNPKMKTHSQVSNSNFRLLFPHRSTQNHTTTGFQGNRADQGDYIETRLYLRVFCVIF